MKCGHHIITEGCKECEKLQAKWYRKLKGFDDAESMRYGDDRPLKVWHSTAFQKTSLLEIEITHDYIEKAQELLHAFQFENEIQRRIWELHCEGMSRHKIEFAIRHLKNAPKASTIRLIIMDLEREIQW